MSLKIGDNFSYLARKPLDNRLVFDTIADMVSTAESSIYDGILSYNKQTETFYVFKVSNTVDTTLAKWRELDISGSSIVTEYTQNINYKKDMLVYVDEKIARVLNDFTSDNTQSTVRSSFEEDIKNNLLSVVNTDHTKILNEYIQLNHYDKNTLVYCNKLIARVLKDFTADTSAVTVEDSFKVDVTAGNLIVLNEEAEPGILPYKQNNFYSKDKLVFADGRIGRVLNDYISDSTGVTLEESINIDIASGNLREMAENYKFKLYKTTQDMNKSIDAINTLPINSIIFENNETIANMQINEGVYGPLGTLALIKEIDINTGTIKAKTVNSREMEFMPPAPNSYRYTVNLQGSGYSTGQIISTSLPGVNAEITAVGSGGGITAVAFTSETITNATGAGADIHADLILYVGNGKQWYEAYSPDGSSTVREYVQGEIYKQNELIVFGDILVKATTDFISDNLLSTTLDSFKFDQDNGNILRISREDIDVPECLGSVKTESSSDLPTLAIKGNWVLIDNCTITAPGQAGIGVYDGTSWNVSPIPQGTFQFPEPSADGKLYLRKRDIGQTEGQWELFSEVDGNNVTIKMRELNDLTDNNVIPENGEFVWDTNRKILVRGDGITTLGSLKSFYDSSTLTAADIISSLGYTPEDSTQKGQANGYAPLDANGLVPVGNLPASLTDTYSKSEIDNKDTAVLNSATALVNTEATRAKGIENGLRTDLDAHIADNTKHVTQNEKDAWDAKVDSSDLTNYDNHLSDTAIHVTQADKDKWDGMNKAYFVTSVSDLPATGNQIGNIGYVQISNPGVVPMVCNQYLWTGTTWKLMDSSQVSISFTWGNLQDKPASTPLTIDNTVTVAHNHNNKIVLDKIGQSAAGNFTYDGIEIGVKVIFLANENLLPTVGETDTLYIIYEDSRVRNYPSISVYRDGSYQILGRGTQDAPPVVGDMSILQSEYFSVVKNSTYNITVTSNQFFAFMPVEILREIEGLKNQDKTFTILDDPSNFDYNEDLFSIDPTNKLKISIQDKSTILDTVSNFYYSHVEVDLSDYKDIDNIG